ncbi:multitransmembrane protein, partial [Biomphalaria glabrata]
MKEITEVRLIVDSVIQLWGCFLLGGTGVVSNALNIAVFWRLGFRETANISLMLIAVIDCVKCSVSFLYRGYGLAGLFDVVLEVNWTRVTYLLNAHVQNLGVPMVSVVTMYVTVESSTLKNLSTNTVALADKEKSIPRCDRESNVSSSHEDTSIEHTSAHPRQSKIFKVRRRFQGGRGSTLKTRQSDVHLSKKESRLVKMLLLIIL